MIWLGALVGCHGDPEGHGHHPPTDGSTGDTGPTTVVGTGDTGTEPTGDYPRPTALSASCEPTDNPLRFACRVTVDPPQPVAIAFAKADGSGIERIHRGSAAAADQDVPLYFMAADTEYTWTAYARDWPADPVVTGAVTTGPVPDQLDAGLTVVGRSSTPYVGANLPCGFGANAGVFDTVTGELLWYQVADDHGHFGGFEMVTFTEDHTLLGQSGSEVMEISLTGEDLLRKLEDLDYPEDLHHDLFRHDGLTYLLYHQGSPVLDGFLVWDRAGNEVTRWFSEDHLLIPDWAAGDWMHTNTIFVRNGGVYLSSYAQNSVFKVDGDLASPTFGELEWVMGGSAPEGLGNDFDLDWSRVDGPDGFTHQHDVHLMDDGRLLMLDNFDGRALVVDIDEVAHTGIVEAAYPTTQGACGPQGTATETAAGNLLVDCSGLALQEFVPGAGEPVWTATLACASSGTLPGGPGPGGGLGAGASRWYPLDGW